MQFPEFNTSRLKLVKLTEDDTKDIFTILSMQLFLVYYRVVN
jgi:hypothetical protein